MTQRTEEIAAPAGNTALVTPKPLGTISVGRSRYYKDFKLARPSSYCSGDEAVGADRTSTHNRELAARPDVSSSSAEGRLEKGQEGISVVLQGYLKIKEDKALALKNMLTRNGNATRLQPTRAKQTGNLTAGLSSQANTFRGAPNTSCEKLVGPSWVQASSGFLDHLESMWKQKASREVEQFRGDLDSFEYTMPAKTEQQLMALNRSQLIEYIGLLHKDSQYVGQLAVESKTKLQRMSAEVEYLNKQVQSLKQELEVQAALYMDKMNRHPAAAKA